ncbi:MAG: S1 RNA-binding domain-containing protein, partial [Candidatus Acidiferrales bacterium]
MSPEHDSNAPASANEMNANENAGENPANPAVTGPANNAGATLSHADAPMTNNYGSQGAATAAVRAPEVVVEPPCETRAEVTEAEAHAANVHPDVAEQTPTHAPVEPVVEGDPAFAGNAKASGVTAAERKVVARTEEVVATSPAETGAAVVDPDVAHAAHEAATKKAEAADAIESHETMEQLLEQFPTPEPVAAEGEIFDGRVVSVTDAGVVVDVGGKFEGLVPAQEFADSGSPIEFGPGQTIEVERLHETKDGYVLLSHVRAHRRRVWERIDKTYREHQTVKGKVTERIKGGLVVDIGVRSFLPASQIELRPVHDLDAWKDKDIEVRVLKLNRKRGNVVVSRRAILEEEQKAKRSSLLDSLHEGSVVTGKVKNVTDYGVFVDLGGMDGLLHVSDLVWGRVPHPSTIVKAGDDLEVQVLKFDKEKQRISLGRKQLLPDPWATVPERFPVGMKLTGKVVGVTDYGAFVQIEP